MCELCGPKKREHANNVAEQLERLAARYRDMGYGRLDPHSDAVKPTAALAKTVLRELVEWI